MLKNKILPLRFAWKTRPPACISGKVMVYVLALGCPAVTGNRDLAALRRQGYGLFAAEIWFKSQKLLRQFRGMEISQCPFANLPEAKGGRWGQGLTAEKMKDCRWLRPELVGRFEFLEWTPDDHLRHTRFIGLREDKKTSDVTREPTT